MPQQFAEHAWTSHRGVNWETKVLNFAISGSEMSTGRLECWLMMNHTEECE